MPSALHITYSFLPLKGGADIYLYLLYRTLEEKGFQQRVLQKRSGVAHPCIYNFPPLPSLKGHDFWLYPLFLLPYAPLLAKHDLLIIHYSPYFLPVLWHKRTITISHGVTWDDAPHKPSAKLKKALARLSFRRSTAFVANDTFFLREMGVSLPPGERKFQEIMPLRWFIPNCVDEEAFSPRSEAPKEVILVPRNLYFSRGVHIAIQAFDLIKKEIPSFSLWIAGGLGQVGYANYLKDLVRERGLEDRVKFLGSIPWKRMRSLYNQASICLIPSLYGEGTSLSALEAMASGVATISTSVGGLADLPTEKCQPNPQSLSESILKVLPRAKEIGERQREMVREEFSLKKWRESWLEVVERTIMRKEER